MLKQQDLIDSLSPEIEPKKLERFNVAFRTLGYQDDYCRYHYEMFQREFSLFKLAQSGKLENEVTVNPQYYRIAFEANIYAFFRCFHSLIESIPYLLNILIDAKSDIEDKNIKWKSITEFCKKSKIYYVAIEKIEETLNANSYLELDYLVNISKHRRIVRIDSGQFSISKMPKFHRADLDKDLRNYEVKILMENIYNDLFPKAIDIIKYFQEIKLNNISS